MTYSEAFRRSNGYCEYCGKDLLTTFEDWQTGEVEHIDPVREGNDPDNLAIACRACNTYKARKRPWQSGQAPQSREDKIREIRLWPKTQNKARRATFSKGVKEKRRGQEARNGH